MVLNTIDEYYFDRAAKDLKNIIELINRTSLSSNEVNILKSSVFIVAYNMIEGSIINTLLEICNAYNTASTPIFQLRKEWQEFICDLGDIQVSLSSQKKIPLRSNKHFYKVMFKLPILGHDKKIFLQSHYSISEDKKQLKKIFNINGNIEEKTLKHISDTLCLGFTINLKQLYIDKHITNSLEKRTFNLNKEYPLGIIKIKRNALGHGGEEFSNTTERFSEMSMSDLEELMNSAVIYIDEFKKCSKAFIDKQGWREPNVLKQLLNRYF